MFPRHRPVRVIAATSADGPAPLRRRPVTAYALASYGRTIYGPEKPTNVNVYTYPVSTAVPERTCFVQFPLGHVALLSNVLFDGAAPLVRAGTLILPFFGSSRPVDTDAALT
ncbi:MAG TPA: hypothetical protein VE869_00195 [Gemmatimonas sp.]|nr:hypothetical protein [Gemmatimonas sp.]